MGGHIRGGNTIKRKSMAISIWKTLEKLSSELKTGVKFLASLSMRVYLYKIKYHIFNLIYFLYSDLLILSHMIPYINKGCVINRFHGHIARY